MGWNHKRWRRTSKSLRFSQAVGWASWQRLKLEAKANWLGKEGS